MTAHRIEYLLQDAARRLPDAVALVAGDSGMTYQELASRVAAFAARLVASGVVPGDRVAVYLDKTPDCVVAIWAVWAAGGIMVPVNENLHQSQVRHILLDADAGFLVSNPRKCRALPAELLAGIEMIEVAADADAPPPRDDTLPGENEAAAILYTSGSSGRPKGILVSHANLLAGARIVGDYLGIRRMDRILSVLPFSFDYGLNQLLLAARAGATCVLQRSALPAHVCHTLQEQEITVLAGVPPFWIQLQQDTSPFAQMSFPALRLITNSGGAFPERLVRLYREQLPGVQLFLMYGLSEAFRSSYLDPEEVEHRPGSIGKPMAETQLLLVDERGASCTTGQIGELVHAGPTVALGYWRNPEATAAVFRPHPFDPSAGNVVYTGDLARMDSDGYFYFVARNNQMIKSMGYRISPDEVEEHLQASGLLAEVAAGGKEDDLAGQVVVVHVVPRDPDAFELDDLIRYCRRELPSYMVPRQFEVHAALPRTNSGKLDRQVMFA